MTVALRGFFCAPVDISFLSLPSFPSFIIVSHRAGTQCFALQLFCYQLSAMSYKLRLASRLPPLAFHLARSAPPFALSSL